MLLDLAGAEALNKVYFSNHYSSAEPSDVVSDFIESFNKKYNKEPDAFNALGYDLGIFVADAIERAEKIDGESVKKALESTKNFEGVTGTFSIDENHNVVKDIIVIELKDGKQHSTYKVSN